MTAYFANLAEVSVSVHVDAPSSEFYTYAEAKQPTRWPVQDLDLATGLDLTMLGAGRLRQDDGMSHSRTP
jgi:hypothetical protein